MQNIFCSWNFGVISKRILCDSTFSYFYLLHSNLIIMLNSLPLIIFFCHSDNFRTWTMLNYQYCFSFFVFLIKTINGNIFFKVYKFSVFDAIICVILLYFSKSYVLKLFKYGPNLLFIFQLLKLITLTYLSAKKMCLCSITVLLKYSLHVFQLLHGLIYNLQLLRNHPSKGYLLCEYLLQKILLEVI